MGHTAKAQLSLAVLSAAARSLPLQLAVKHVVVELTKAGSRHRQWTSPGWHLLDVALSKQPCAQATKDCHLEQGIEAGKHKPGYPGISRG